jgi:peptidoglycan/xylan/chitin deacetylase (PgdA/CDA1 family)
MIAEGAPSESPCAWITFDDGYANNTTALRLLAAMGIPATIFITTASVECGESFWWDVHWRGWRLRGASPSEIMQRREAMKALSSKEISRALAIEFGPNAVKPHGELDRPMTIAEVTELAKVPYIEIGNHTHHHAILSRCNEKTIVQEIETCQERLETWTGRRPQAIAYPNGNFDARVVKAAREAGLQIGVTCEARRTGLPAPVTERLTIGRSAGLKHGRIGFELAVAECRFPKCAPTRAR